MNRERREWLIVALTIAAAAAFLSLLNVTTVGAVSANYLLGVLLVIGIYALLSLGLSLEFGFTGLVNFGHVAFMAIGGYSVAILVERLEGRDPPLSASLEGAGLGGFVACLLMGGVVALLVLVPALLALARVGRLSATQAQTIAYAAAGLAGVAVLVGTFPLGPREAVHAVVFLAVLAGILAAALAGLLLGLPAIRLREDYLAIVTIGAAEILRQVTLNEHWLTRGSLGFPRLERPLVTWAQTSPFWESAADLLGVRRVALAQTVVTLAALAYAFLVLELLTRSPWGRVLKAIREDEAVAASLGKNASRFKLQSLMIGSGIAALAGVLLVWHLASVYPEHFIHQITFFAFVIIIVGGLGNHKGALIGAVILWTVFEAARNLTFLSRFGLDNLAGAPQSIAVGLLIILVMMFRPQGLVGRKEELAHVR